MQTRSKSGIVKKKVILTTVEDFGGIDLNLIEPSTYKSALKIPVWMSAMKEELSALSKQGTWSLVPLPTHKNLVGCKWIFKIKKHVDGYIARHKARLVAQGFSQEPGLDYGETFSPVVKPTTEVYMAQPLGFLDPHHPELVCKLHKSLHGLKQAPRAWNERFTAFLPSIGFKDTYSDSSLFVKTAGSFIVILLLEICPESQSLEETFQDK
ncbi:hypothetical protein FF2_024519 [Malus domestica]